MDNIPKQILDSLKQRVYEDDRLVRQCLVTDIDVRQEYELLPERISDQQLRELLALLGDENQEHVLYVEIGVLESERVVFGPIDRGVS